MCTGPSVMTPATTPRNLLLALITMGEGGTTTTISIGFDPAKFYWWEIDLTYYCLKLMEWLGLVWDVRDVPVYVRTAKQEA